MAERDDALLIEPVAPPLSRAGVQARRGPGAWRDVWRKVPRRAALGAVAIVLAGAVAFVFLVLPSRIETPTGPLAAPGAATPAQTDVAPTPVPAVAPYQALMLERARQQAREKLGEFVQQQLLLEEEMNVALWGAEELARIKERADAADRLFIDERFDESLVEYEAAVADIAALVQRGYAAFEEALAEGMAALGERDQERAAEAFARALAIRPGHPDATDGAARADNLPLLAEYLREAERAELRGDPARVRELLLKARALDPGVEGLEERLAAAARAKARQDYENAVSAGFAAIDSGDFDAAYAAFDRILAQNPDDAAALSGRQQTQQAQTRARIERYHAEAREHEGLEAWDAALAAYDAALDIDPALEFAREGKERVRLRMDTIAQIDRLLADPALLSSEREYAAARKLFENAAGETGAGAAYEARLDEFRHLFEQATEPVPLVLVSDNATDVVILRVASLGAFDRHEVSLRPGRYTIVGSRDGCRDVRKEITLAPGMAPVDIRCVERI